MKVNQEQIDRAAEAAFRVMYPQPSGWDKWHVEQGPPSGLLESTKAKWREIAVAAFDAGQSASPSGEDKALQRGSQMDTAIILAKRVDDLNQNTRTLVTVYMQWYTFYWMLNSVALAWVWAKPSTSAGNSPPNLVLWFFVIMSLPSAASSFMVLDAVQAMRKEVARLSDRLVTVVGLPADAPCGTELRSSAWPKRVTVWGLSVNGGTTVLLGGIWLYLALR